MSVINKFKESTKELSRTSSLVSAGMILSLNVVIGYYANLSLNIFPTVKISFSFLPKVIAGALFGPVVAGLIGGMGDIISFFINPIGGLYFPGWTINALLSGIIYGLFLYKNNVTVKNIILAKVIVGIFIQLILGTLWLNIQFGYPYLITLSARAVKQLICMPFEIAIIVFITRALKQIPVFQYK